MQVPIKRAIERVPGGMMIVPLALGALIVTFAPATAGFFGSFTGALFPGAFPILPVFSVCPPATLPIEHRMSLRSADPAHVPRDDPAVSAAIVSSRDWAVRLRGLGGGLVLLAATDGPWPLVELRTGRPGPPGPGAPAPPGNA